MKIQSLVIFIAIIVLFTSCVGSEENLSDVSISDEGDKGGVQESKLDLEEELKLPFSFTIEELITESDKEHDRHTFVIIIGEENVNEKDLNQIGDALIELFQKYAANAQIIIGFKENTLNLIQRFLNFDELSESELESVTGQIVARFIISNEMSEPIFMLEQQSISKLLNANVPFSFTTIGVNNSDEYVYVEVPKFTPIDKEFAEKLGEDIELYYSSTDTIKSYLFSNKEAAEIQFGLSTADQENDELDNDEWELVFDNMLGWYTKNSFDHDLLVSLKDGSNENFIIEYDSPADNSDEDTSVGMKRN